MDHQAESGPILSNELAVPKETRYTRAIYLLREGEKILV